MVVEVLQEAFTLTQGDSDVTATDGLNASTAYGVIYEYHVPTGIGLIILPGHTFSLYLYADDSAEMPATSLIKVSVLDASKQDKKTILGPVLYQSLKEFTDRDKLARFNVTAPVKVYEKQYIQIEEAGADATGSGGVDVTGGTNESYFEMTISRVRQPL